MGINSFFFFAGEISYLKSEEFFEFFSSEYKFVDSFCTVFYALLSFFSKSFPDIFHVLITFLLTDTLVAVGDCFSGCATDAYSCAIFCAYFLRFGLICFVWEEDIIFEFRLETVEEVDDVSVGGTADVVSVE